MNDEDMSFGIPAEKAADREHADRSSWSLEGFSQALGRISERRKTEHEEFNRKLEQMKCVVWIPDPDTDGHGIGWFRLDKGFAAYHKYSNGYDPMTRNTLSDDLLRQLWLHMPEAK